jgi:hypothetical protein
MNHAGVARIGKQLFNDICAGFITEIRDDRGRIEYIVSQESSLQSFFFSLASYKIIY